MYITRIITSNEYCLHHLHRTVAPTQSQQPSPLPLTCDPDKLTAVEGIVRSVHDKVAIIAFHTGFSAQLARFVPGQMYIDARKNLGFVIRNRPFHSWPTRLKEFLEHGASLRMDVKRLKEDDVTEARAITGETVLYAATPYVWKGQSRRPLDSENLRISNDRRNLGTKIIMKGVVKKVFSKWGILTIDSFSHGKNVEADVFFKIEHYFNRSTSSTLSSKTDSLLFHVAVGDLVALCCRRKDYLELTELVRNCGMTSADMSTTVGLKYLAMLVWPIAAEVDPYLADVAEEEELPCDFLATSSTLNGQLPASEVFRAWRGIISEIRLPAGGLIELEQQGGAQRERQVAYFHRSRLFVNGAKVSSSTDISVDLAPGDPCTVDVVPNIGLVDDEYDIHIPWVATAVHTTNRDRGTRIADVLRIKEVEIAGALSSICSGKTVVKGSVELEFEVSCSQCFCSLSRILPTAMLKTMTTTTVESSTFTDQSKPLTPVGLASQSLTLDLMLDKGWISKPHSAKRSVFLWQELILGNFSNLVSWT